MYADADARARKEIARRIAAVGKSQNDFITYSKLVSRITCKLANVNDGKPFEIAEWTDLDRAIIGNFLGRVAADSYCEGGFLSSALFIGVDANGPGEGFYSLAEEAGLLRTSDETARLKFWIEQIALARAWFAAH